MNKFVKYFMFLIAVVFVLGVNNVSALTVEEKWDKLTKSFEYINEQSDGSYSVSYDEKSLIISYNYDNDRYQCKYTLQDDIISFNNDYNETSCKYYSEDIIYGVVELFGYDYDDFSEWFQNNYAVSSLEKDGFSVRGTLEKSELKLDSNSGMGFAGSYFDNFYLKEGTDDIMVQEIFKLNEMKLDLNRGFVSFAPIKDTENNVNKEPVKENNNKVVQTLNNVPNTLSNTSPVVIAIALGCMIFGTAIICKTKSKKRS